MIATEKHTAALRTNIEASGAPEAEQLDKLLYLAERCEFISKTIKGALGHREEDGSMRAPSDSPTLGVLADALGDLESFGRIAKGWLSE